MDEPHIRIVAALIPLLLVLGFSQDARAQGAAAAAAAAPAAPTSSGEVGIGLGFGQVDEDFFLSLSVQFGMQLTVPRLACNGFFPLPVDQRPADVPCTTRLRFGLQVPLRLRVYDRAPETDAVLRREDWDEVSDYFRVLRFVEYGDPTEPVYGRLGELAGVVIGHGTIMNGYYNIIDVDHHQFGMHSVLNSRYGGVELMLDNFVDPEVLGYRLYTYPVRFIQPASFWRRYAVGTSLLLDIDAPERFERVDVSVDPNLPFKVSDDRNLVPEKTDVTGVLGIDQELQLVRESWIDFTPFWDTNFHLDGSPGIHLGAFTNVRPLEQLHLDTRTELRWLGNNYIPDYFSSLYEIERNTYFGFGGTGQPKRVVLEELDQGQILGAYLEATLRLYQLLTLTAAYEDYQGPRNAAILLRATLTDLGPFRLGGFYRRAGFNGLSDAFGLENALMVGELRYQVNTWLYLSGQYSRLYRLQEDGSFDTVDDWNVGAGAALQF